MEKKVLFLTSCKDAMEAEIVKGALKDMGIECILQGENMSHIYGGIGAMNVNVLVDEDDYDKARAFIDSREEIKPIEIKKPERLSIKRIVKKDLLLSLLMSGLLLMLKTEGTWQDKVEFFLLQFVFLFIVFGSLQLLERKYYLKKKS